jgi:hypothetical protein
MIGEGGMGTVLAAHHELLDISVAVKLLSPSFVRSGPMVERFVREARAAARLKSEHVARVTDVGTLESGQPYIVMELLQGEDLDQRRERFGKLPVKEAVDFAIQALEAIAQAHATGIVHRDLKPANLFLAVLPDGREIVKVLDFGTAKLMAPEGGASTGSLTGEQALGSPSYMAPEQIRNASNVDHRADIWAVGVILYDLMTGHLPFRGDSVGEILGNVLVGKTPALRGLRPDAPAELEAAVDRCMQREPEKRFPNVYELARALAPHGSGAWSGYVEQIAQTLARGGAPVLLEDTDVRRSPYLHPGGETQARTEPPRAIEAARVRARSRRTAIVVTVAGVVIFAFAALAVLRPRRAARDPLLAPGAPTSSAGESEAIGPSADSRSNVPLTPAPSATVTSSSPDASPRGSALPRTAPAESNTPGTHRPTKRPPLLDSPY